MNAWKGQDFGRPSQVFEKLFLFEEQQRGRSRVVFRLSSRGEERTYQL